MHHLTRLVLVLGAVNAALFGGCATEEIPQYGDPAHLVGSAGATAGSGEASSSSGSSSSGMCVVDAGCNKTFTDVFQILATKGKCSDANCHAIGSGQEPELPDLTMAANEKATYDKLIAYLFKNTSKYIAPCDPMGSKMTCNMKIDADAGVNTYGDCPSRMPKVSAADMVDDAYLTQDEVNTIAEWISCGAPSP